MQYFWRMTSRYIEKEIESGKQKGREDQENGSEERLDKSRDIEIISRRRELERETEKRDQ